MKFLFIPEMSADHFELIAETDQDKAFLNKYNFTYAHQIIGLEQSEKKFSLILKPIRCAFQLSLSKHFPFDIYCDRNASDEQIALICDEIYKRFYDDKENELV